MTRRATTGAPMALCRAIRERRRSSVSSSCWRSSSSSSRQPQVPPHPGQRWIASVDAVPGNGCCEERRRATAAFPALLWSWKIVARFPERSDGTTLVARLSSAPRTSSSSRVSALTAIREPAVALSRQPGFHQIRPATSTSPERTHGGSATTRGEARQPPLGSAALSGSRQRVLRRRPAQSRSPPPRPDAGSS
jgi:hypothetical protein